MGTIRIAGRPDPATYMLAVASTEGGRTYKDFARRCLRLMAGLVVVDAGCGPGTDLPSLADEVGPLGKVIGVDHDEDMLVAARERVAGIRTIEVQAGDIHALPFPDRSIDRVRTDRVLQHVTDPQQALAELLRVTRPGGVAVIAEPDYGTLVVDSAFEGTSAAFVSFTTQRVVRNATLGRQVGRLATSVGWSRSAVDGMTTTLADFGAADRLLGLGRNSLKAVGAGYMTADEREVWLGSLIEQPLLAAVTVVVTTLTKPAP